MKTPDGPGIWIFDGHRRTGSGRWLVTVYDLVEVRRVLLGITTALEVVTMGCAKRHHVDEFEGTFTRVEIDFEKERTP